MFKILSTKALAPNIKCFEFEAPYIAQKAQPGQFVVVRINETGERIPLTIADTKKDQGVVIIVFQEVGKTTKLLGTLKAGDYVLDLLGPLGKPSEIKYYGTVVCIGGGVGTPEIYPIARALKEIGNKVVTIIGARTKELLIMVEEMRSVSDELYITTDDGSYGTKGLVTDELKRLISQGIKIDKVFAVGPVIMMKAVSETTRPYNIPTVVSLNPIMLDATGMCGVCRVEVGGETKFACVDGPEFDGHQVNFDTLMMRLKTYLKEERVSLELFEKQSHKCCGGQ
ncbi:MAG: sulfide/dihydroorotate dehydrogenase-like FAD/NAD-binding protein [candidate division WOR-3 bacterium]